MGGAASRVAQPASRAARRSDAAAAAMTENLANLPATSAVRRDAEEKVVFAQQRLEQEAELNTKSLEELSSRDDEWTHAMEAVVQNSAADIRYKEYLIPLLDESDQNQQMIRLVKEEMVSTETAFATRTQTEAIGQGRITLANVKSALGAIQQARGQESIVQRLATQHKVDPEVLAHFASHCSIPDVTVSQLGSKQTMVAKWQ